MSEQLPEPGPLAPALLRCPDPPSAERRLTRLLAAGGPVARLVGASPAAVARLLHVLSISPFLADHLARHPQSLSVVLDEVELAEVPGRSQLVRTLEADSPEPWLAALLRRQRSELLRIVSADLDGRLGSRQVTEQLSRLAEAVVEVCLRRGARPRDAAGLTVLALGKLGGEELNVSSDIDLVFVAAGDVEAGSRAARALCRTLGDEERLLYRVDVRLRPWGGSGPLVVSADGLVDYLSRRARPWERQAMLKARPVAGDVLVGAALLQRVGPLLLGGARGSRARVRAHKEAIEREAPRGGPLDVKLAPGGIRDVEFTVQALQLEHGGSHPALLTGNTRAGIDRLAGAGLLATPDAETLAEGYRFLRDLEHRLQLADYRQVHALPAEASQLAVLARSLGLSGAGALRARVAAVMVSVREVFERLLPPGGAP